VPARARPCPAPGFRSTPGLVVGPAGDGVSSAKIAKSAVTSPKIANGSVTSAKIAAGAVTASQIAPARPVGHLHGLQPVRQTNTGATGLDAECQTAGGLDTQTVSLAGTAALTRPGIANLAQVTCSAPGVDFEDADIMATQVGTLH
jgi:hypothetical protein